VPGLLGFRRLPRWLGHVSVLNVGQESNGGTCLRTLLLLYYELETSLSLGRLGTVYRLL
jgi:hypothetical protein